MNHVLDACATIAYLRGEPGADLLAGLLSDPQHMSRVRRTLGREARRMTPGAAEALAR